MVQVRILKDKKEKIGYVLCGYVLFVVGVMFVDGVMSGILKSFRVLT